MILTRIEAWLGRMWERAPDPGLLQAYRVTFSTLHGQQVLTHLVDSVYCTVCEGTDPIALATHNGRRTVVQEILENLDMAERPDKYRVAEEVS